MAQKEKVTFAKTTAALDLEAREKADFRSADLGETKNPGEGVELDKDGFVGTDPIYQNYAVNGLKPYGEDSADDEDEDDKKADEKPPTAPAPPK